MNRNVPILGFIMGLLLPAIGVFIMYLLWGHGESFMEFLRLLTQLRGMAAKVLTLGLLINLVPFVYYTSKRLDYTARGIFIATMIYALIVVFIKFIW